MSEKNCIKCGVIKPFSEFTYRKKNKDKKRNTCKTCESSAFSAYSKTKNGLIAIMYSGQRGSSKARGHNMPSYSLDEFRSWVLSRDIFHALFDKWVDSGYEKQLIPSCDRVDDSQGYSLNRLQIMTWKENNLKWHKGVIDGTNKGRNRPVIQMNLDGTFVNEFHSIAEARRVINNGIHITDCCRGKRKTCAGYRWIHSLGVPIHNNSK